MRSHKANSRAGAGGYFEAYVGVKMTCSVSKCSHKGGVGFVMRPCRKVSAPSRTLNSSMFEGRGQLRIAPCSRNSRENNPIPPRLTHRCRISQTAVLRWRAGVSPSFLLLPLAVCSAVVSIMRAQEESISHSSAL